MTNCVCNGAPNGVHCGIIVGENKGAIKNCRIQNCQLTSLSGSYNSIGGICGFNSGSVTNCKAFRTTASGSPYSNNDASAGGLVGINNGSLINGYVSSISCSGWKRGYVAGQNNGNIVGCTSTGTCSIGSGTYGGSITGMNYGTVANCKTTTDLKLVGYGYDPS